MNKKIGIVLFLSLFLCGGCEKKASGEDMQNEPIVKSTVFYFHGKQRCVSCIKIEKYTREVFLENFKDNLDLKVVDVEIPENAHFIIDYNLYTKSVVLVKIKDGKEVGYKNLDKVWNYLGNEVRFKEYVKSEIDGFLLGE